MAEQLAKRESAPESDVQLKKRARRRLVGASALALLAVIVLPMVMDHQPRPPLQDIQVRIPAQDAGGFAAPPPGKPGAAPSMASSPPPPVAASEPTPAPAAEPKAAPAVAPPPAPVAAAPKAADTPAPEAPVAPRPEAAKPPAKAEPPKAAAKPAEAAEQWVVQLGAYKEQANVRQLMAKLKEMGVPAYTEPFDSPGGPRTRVRAGPFPSKEAAERARVSRIKKIGVDGPVAPK